MDSVTSCNFDGLDDALTQFAQKSITKQMLADGSVNVTKKITEIQNEIKTIENKNIKVSPISAPDSGYYVNSLDGYENTLSYDDVLTLTPDKINSALESDAGPVKDGSLGKLVVSYRWYVVGIVDSEYSTEFSGGGKVTVNFPESGLKDVIMNVDSVKNNDESIVVVLSCDLMNETYANMRKEKVEVVTSSGTGYKVPASAVRFDGENQSGIYVLRGKIITFVPAEVLYSDEKNAIVSSADSKGGGIALYDEVVTKGKELKDGKVIR